MQNLLDVLITDIKMPLMDGLKLIEWVSEKYPEVHIIVLSGFSDFEYARKALKFKVTDYLLKPIDKYELFEILNKVQKDKANEHILDEQKSDVRQPSDHYVIDEVRSILEKEYGKTLSE